MVVNYIKLCFYIITIITVCVIVCDGVSLHNNDDSKFEYTTSGLVRIVTLRTHLDRKHRSPPSFGQKPVQGRKRTSTTPKPSYKTTSTRPLRTTTATRPSRKTTATWPPPKATATRPSRKTTSIRPPPSRTTTIKLTTTTAYSRPTTRSTQGWIPNGRITVPPTTSRRPKMKLKLSEARYKVLFGGLSGTAVGAYLGYQIGKIDEEVDLPAYSVQHYWHQQGSSATTNTVVDSKAIRVCSKNVNFCVPGTSPMCLSSGKVYCVVPEFQIQQCTNSTARACVPSTLRLPCKNRFSVECFFTGYRYKEVSIPCLRYIKLIYRSPLTNQTQPFFIPSKYSKSPANNTCKCNITQTQSVNKVDVMCIKVNVSDAEKILCSGLNLSNATLITLNSTLNATNSIHVSCLQNLSVTSNVMNIIEAHRTLTLARCEIRNDAGPLRMSCGHLGSFVNRNITIPIDSNVIALNCVIENSTRPYGNFSAVNGIANATNTCLCNGTLTANNISCTNQTANRNITVNSVRYCVLVSAFPFKLYNNKDYIQYLNVDAEEEQWVTNVANQMLTALAYYIWY
ncbi:hypothetical protein Trydic_g7343 [Trypoxylus dichotomus]